MEEWKRSDIVSILKSSHKALACNYHPILLLSTVSKILEKHIYNLVLPMLRHPAHYHQANGDSYPGDQPVQPLLTVTDEWHWILKQNVEVGAIFFDIKKALERCPIGLSLINSLTWAFTHISCSG